MQKVWRGQIGQEKSIEDFSEAQARQIFGNQLYEAWKKAQSQKAEPKALEVKSICKKTKTITVG
jgi:hypothetical protein